MPELLILTVLARTLVLESMMIKQAISVAVLSKFRALISNLVIRLALYICMIIRTRL